MPPAILMRPELVHSRHREASRQVRSRLGRQLRRPQSALWIGEVPAPNEQLLVDNVMPIYWTINAMVSSRRAGPVPSPQRRLADASHSADKHRAVLRVESGAGDADEGDGAGAGGEGLGAELYCAREDRGHAHGAITDRSVLRKLRGWTEEEANAYALRNVPARRFTTTKEVVEAMFGILTMPSYVNGACIDMTGGA
jgi:hypothetical protein